MRFLPSSISDNAVTNITGTTVGNKHGQDVNIVGTGIGSPLDKVSWDALDVQQTSATVETYLFYLGGLAGTLQATCTVTYVAADKNDLDTVVWT